MAKWTNNEKLPSFKESIKGACGPVPSNSVSKPKMGFEKCFSKIRTFEKRSVNTKTASNGFVIIDNDIDTDRYPISISIPEMQMRLHESILIQDQIGLKGERKKFFLCDLKMINSYEL